MDEVMSYTLVVELPDSVYQMKKLIMAMPKHRSALGGYYRYLPAKNYFTDEVYSVRLYIDMSRRDVIWSVWGGQGGIEHYGRDDEATYEHWCRLCLTP
jgi:hypothetical protein